MSLSVSEVIERQVKPALQAHNGGIELLDVSAAGIVRVKLTGACSCCPGAQLTLQDTVEALLKQACPGVSRVVAVQESSEELIAAALRLLRRGKAGAGY